MKSLKTHRFPFRSAALALGAVLLISPMMAFADQSGTVQLVNSIIQLLTTILSPLVFLIDWMLSPSWTSGDIFNMRPAFKEMWVLVSNIVYTIFALVLLGIAFVNIFGIGGDDKKYQLKAMLPRFVIGILIVPFTWFIVSATLSVTNVLTASVLRLPYDIITKTGDSSLLESIKIPKDIRLTLGSSGNKPAQENAKCERVRTASGTYLYGDDYNDPNKCVSLGTVLSGNGSFSPIAYFAYQIFKIQTVKVLTGDDFNVEGGIKTLVDIILKISLAGIFILVFAVVLLALLFALGTRMVMLWIYTIFSPVFGLAHMMSGSAPEGIKKLLEKLSFKEFLSLAMVPVYVAAALSLAVIVTYKAQNMGGIGSQTTSKTSQPLVDPITGNSIASSSTGTVMKVGAISVTVVSAGGSSGAVAGLLGTGQDAATRAIISLIALVLLWMAVMAALQASEITKSAVEPFVQMGSKVAEFAKSAPKYAPILPGGLSLASLPRLADMPKNALENKMSANLGPAQTGINSFFGVSTIDVRDKTRFNELAKTNLQSENDLRDMQAVLKSMAGTVGTKSPEWQRYFLQYAQKMKEAKYINVDPKWENFGDSSGLLNAKAVGMLEEGIGSDFTVDEAMRLKVANELHNGQKKTAGTKDVLPDELRKKLKTEDNKINEKTFVLYKQESNGSATVIVEINDQVKTPISLTKAIEISKDDFGLSDVDAKKLTALLGEMDNETKQKFANKLAPGNGDKLLARLTSSATPGASTTGNGTTTPSSPTNLF